MSIGLFQPREQGLTGRRHPAAMNGRIRRRWNLPVLFKTTEVIQPEDIKQLKLRAESFQPPAEIVLHDPVPAIQRIPPSLPRRREVIGWHAGYDFGPARLIQGKQVAVGPDIGTVMCYKNRNIAKQRDAVLMRIVAQGSPLGKKCELLETYLFTVLGMFITKRPQRSGIPVAKRCRPIQPGSFSLCMPDGPKEGVIIQPGGMLLPETGIRGTLAFMR